MILPMFASIPETPKSACDKSNQTETDSEKARPEIRRAHRSAPCRSQDTVIEQRQQKPENGPDANTDHSAEYAPADNYSHSPVLAHGSRPLRLSHSDKDPNVRPTEEVTIHSAASPNHTSLSRDFGRTGETGKPSR
jgi:hypothetical protein